MADGDLYFVFKLHVCRILYMRIAYSANSDYSHTHPCTDHSICFVNKTFFPCQEKYPWEKSLFKQKLYLFTQHHGTLHRNQNFQILYGRWKVFWLFMLYVEKL